MNRTYLTLSLAALLLFGGLVTPLPADEARPAAGGEHSLPGAGADALARAAATQPAAAPPAVGVPASESTPRATPAGPRPDLASSEAAAGQYPWMVKVYNANFSGGAECGGTLIARDATDRHWLPVGIISYGLPANCTGFPRRGDARLRPGGLRRGDPGRGRGKRGRSTATERDGGDAGGPRRCAPLHLRPG